MPVTKENQEFLPKRVRIIQDFDPINPREDDNVGTMVCWHSRYNLGDEQPKESPQDYKRSLVDEYLWKLVENTDDSIDDVPQDTVEELFEEHFISLPLYLYDHSGITISTGPFSCPWDSGQVGFIYCSKEKAIAECSSVENAEEYLRGEVETYDQFLTGDVYGFEVEALDYETGDWEAIDSCWGFYGSDPKTNGMAEHLGDEKLIEMACEAEVEYPR